MQSGVRGAGAHILPLVAGGGGVGQVAALVALGLMCVGAAAQQYSSVNSNGNLTLSGYGSFFIQGDSRLDAERIVAIAIGRAGTRDDEHRVPRPTLARAWFLSKNPNGPRASTKVRTIVAGFADARANKAMAANA